MYLDFFGLNEMPFELTTNPKYLLYTAHHRWAFHHLVNGILERKGFIQVTGEVGTGKSTICRAIIGHLANKVTVSLLVNPPKDDEELIEAVATEFGLDVTNRSRNQRLQTINRYLKEENQKGVTPVIIIDEAQNLGPSALEEVRQLANFETNAHKLVQIVLLGQPELKALLEKPELRQLYQRITVRFHIAALTRTETEQYVQHRLQIAGSKGVPKFTNMAYWAIQKATQGIPRSINAICDKCLLVAFARKTHSINWAIVRKAKQELRGEAF